MKVLDRFGADASSRLSGTFKQAVMLGIEAAVRYHLQKGQNVNARDNGGQTPLIIAAARGHAHVCSILLDAGADPALKDSAGRTALDIASSRGWLDVRDLLAPVPKEAEPVAVEESPSAQGPASLSTAGARPVILEASGREGSELDLTAWQPEVEMPPPVEDPTVLASARRAQRELGKYVPEDADADWSDVDIELPEIFARWRLRDAEKEQRWLGNATSLVLIALRDGEIPESLIENIAPVALGNDSDEDATDYDGLLRTTVGDLGARVEADEESRIIFDGPDEDSEERYDEELKDAIQFLRTCLERAEEPFAHYMNALSGINVLSREEELAIGQAKEQGMFMALTAIASSGVAMDAIMETFDRVERQEVPWKSVFDDNLVEETSDEAFGDDSAEGAERSEGADKAEGMEARAGFPASVKSFMESVRNGYANFRVAGPEDASRLARELAGQLQALRLQADLFEHLKNIVTDREENLIVRENLLSGLKKAEAAKGRLFQHNQKLVLWVARKYGQSALPLMDRIQEGSLGLMKAAERFDCSREARFATYAIWWIRQSISRAIADQSRLIRVPVHMVEVVNKVRRAKREHELLNGSEPTVRELAETLEITEKVAARALPLLQDTVSLDQIEDGDSGFPGLLADDAPPPDETILEKARKSIVHRVLAGMQSRPRDIICRRFGIGYEGEQTLEEVGHAYGVTRERIRQIEAKAMRCLSHPLRCRQLRPFL